MDPQATWDALLRSLAAGEWRKAAVHAADLRRWLDHAGFPPDTTNGQFNDRYWNLRIATLGCKLARQIARRRLDG